MRDRRAFWSSALGACVVFLALGHALHLTAGGRGLARDDIFFGADALKRCGALCGVTAPKSSVSHMLLGHVWGRLGSALRAGLTLVIDPQSACVLAARTLTASVAALGIGALVACLARTVHDWRVLFCAWLLLVGMTANTVTVLTDHPGLSFGMLSLFLLIVSDRDAVWTRRRVAGLTVLAVLIAGTTLTNVACCVLAVVWFHFDSVRRTVRGLARDRRVLWAAAVGGAAVILVAFLIGGRVVSRLTEGDTIVTQGLREESQAGMLNAAAFLVLPIVGPAPRVRETDSSILSYNSVGASRYGVLDGAAALAWCTLLAWSAYRAIRTGTRRTEWWLALSWGGANYAFHTFWGDQVFLFAPHWTPTLALAGLTAFEVIERRWILCATAIIAAGQFVALRAIVAAIP